MGTDKLWPFAFALPGFNAILMLIVLPCMPRSPKYLLLSRYDRNSCMKSVSQFISQEHQKHVFDELIGEAQNSNMVTILYFN